MLKKSSFWSKILHFRAKSFKIQPSRPRPAPQATKSDLPSPVLREKSHFHTLNHPKKRDTIIFHHNKPITTLRTDAGHVYLGQALATHGNRLYLSDFSTFSAHCLAGQTSNVLSHDRNPAKSQQKSTFNHHKIPKYFALPNIFTPNPGKTPQTP